MEWWLKYLPQFQGTGMLWMYNVSQPDKVAASDACLTGMGAVSDKEYIKMEFDDTWIGKNVAYLELLAVIVMCKTWIDKFTGKLVRISCDNQAVVQVLNTGRAHDSVLLMLMREMIFIAAGKFEFKTIYVRSKLNILPDLLSRWKEGEIVHHKFYDRTNNKGFKEIKIAPDVCVMSHMVMDK